MIFERRRRIIPIFESSIPTYCHSQQIHSRRGLQLKDFFAREKSLTIMPEIGNTGVVFETVAREWRCKWSEAEDKASLKAAQDLLVEYTPKIKGVAGRIINRPCAAFNEALSSASDHSR